MELSKLFVPTNASETWTALAAVGTFAAVVVALWPLISRWWDRPRLTVKIALTPPHCQLLDNHYYLRLWAFNDGTQPAEHVQVFVSGLTRVQGQFDDASFLPQNLRWTHAPHEHSTFLERMNPKMGHHCELGMLSNGGPDTKASLLLALEVPRVALPPGVYRLALSIAASNVTPVEKIIQLEIEGSWHDDYQVMFDKYLGLKVVA